MPVSGFAMPSSVKNLTFALLLIAQPAAAQRTPPIERFPAELDRYIAQALAAGDIPGLAIAVVRHDSVLVAKGYGVRELGRPERVDENTIFDIASLAKSFTATAAAMLVDSGLVRWDDPVQRHLPELVLPGDLTGSATVRDFLSHRSGLEPANTMWVLTALERSDVLRRMRHLGVRAPLREAMIYSNVGVTVAGEALAAASGRSFEVLLRDYLIRPLGLTSTTWTYEQSVSMPNVAGGHARVAGRQQQTPRETQRDATAPAGAVQASVQDMTRWLRLHLNMGVLDGKRYVSEAAMRELHSIQVPIVTTPEMRAPRMVQDTVIGYGLGWQMMDYRGHPLHWHSGSGNGQYAYMVLLPRERIGVVVLVNTWIAANVHIAITNRILDVYLGYEPRDWVADELQRAQQIHRQQDAGHAEMKAMRSTSPPPLPLSAYAGTYDEPRFGPLHVRLQNGALSLQMGDGQIADLEYHGGNAFFTSWRDPFFREYYGSHIEFVTVDGIVARLNTRINRDTFTAVRVRNQ